MTKIKTGHVFQVSAKGQNYIALGSAMVDGKLQIIATRNGNIKLDGNSKHGSPIVRRKSAKLGKVGTRLALHMFETTKIYKIHDRRPVNLKSVWTIGNADESTQKQVKRINAGVNTTAYAL